uniref:Putative drebrin n=1 Tax=Ixodes ricinus TaxID=34613 RepID=A0A0K8R3U5_IXORI
MLQAGSRPRHPCATLTAQGHSLPLEGLHIVGREEPDLPVALAAPPALVDRLNVRNDVVGIKGNLVVVGGLVVVERHGRNLLLVRGGFQLLVDALFERLPWPGFRTGFGLHWRVVDLWYDLLHST